MPGGRSVWLYDQAQAVCQRRPESITAHSRQTLVWDRILNLLTYAGFLRAEVRCR